MAILILLLLLPGLHCDVQFTTHLSDALETPALKKGAAFIFKYQAVTSERESKVRVFSPFPQMPEINLTQVHILLKSKGNTDSLKE